MEFNCWMVYPLYVSKKNDNAFDWLSKIAEKAGINVRIVFLEDLTPVYQNSPTDSGFQLLHRDKLVTHYPDIVIMRGYESVISRHFELMGIPVVNTTDSMQLAKNKMLTHQALVKHGIPTPRTVYQTAGEYNYDSLYGLFDSLTFIVKRTDGAKGEDVFLIRNEAEMQAAVSQCGGNCICQEYIGSSHGRDVRVWVIGDEAVAGVLRQSTSSFKSNFSLGGDAHHIDLTDEMRELAVRSAKALGLEFAGIDLLFGEEGMTVCEVNGNAGFRTLSKIGENNIPEKLFEYIANKLSRT